MTFPGKTPFGSDCIREETMAFFMQHEISAHELGGGCWSSQYVLVFLVSGPCLFIKVVTGFSRSPIS